MYIDCPLCKKPSEVLIDKKDRPYVKCIGCGMVMFIRNGQGADCLKEISYEGRVVHSE